MVMLCRDTNKAAIAAREIREQTKGEVTVESCNLASLKSISDCVDRLQKSLEKIDILINNAGGALCPLSRTKGRRH